MRILLDTNILVRLVNKDDVQHYVIVSLVRRLYAESHELFAVPQCIYEMWATMTRPIGAPNGLGFTTEQAASEVARLLALMGFLPDTPALFDLWLGLVTKFKVSGRPSHDARLAAAMQAHKLDALLTLNDADFKRYGLNVLTPTEF